MSAPHGKGSVLVGTAILRCECASAFQDARYGAGKRVHNRHGDKNAPKARCTVCARDKGMQATSKGEEAQA